MKCFISRKSHDALPHFLLSSVQYTVRKHGNSMSKSNNTMFPKQQLIAEKVNDTESCSSLL